MYYSRKIEEGLKKHLEGPQALIVTGMRRVGKTTLLKRIYDDVHSNKIWFDFENPLDIQYFEKLDYNDIFEAIVTKGNLHKKERVFVFIDEAHYYPQISKIVKYLIDHYEVKFLLTGSASFYLKNLFPESLAGRKIIYELYPLDFEEFLLFKGESRERYHRIKVKEHITEIEYDLYDAYYNEFVKWGGFPEVILKPHEEDKEIILRDIFTSYYQKEIIQLGDYRKNTKMRELLALLAPRVGSQVDIVKLAQELGVTRTTVYSYLQFLSATYCIHFVPRFSKSIDREVSGLHRVYFCDNGFLRTMASVTSGQLFENAVYNQLKHKGSIAYFRRGVAEIDFIVNKERAYEAKVTATRIDAERLERVIQKANFTDWYVVSQKYATGVRNVIFGEFL